MADVLAFILERKRVEVARRLRHLRAPLRDAHDKGAVVDRAPAAYRALTRAAGARPHVIAEIKHRSPSAGEIRARRAGAVAELARAYAEAGASAISVLCDGPGFGGSPLDARRVAHETSKPVLFKEFVLDEVQVDLARVCGASLVLLLVRALPAARLQALIDYVHARGMAPVVEAADAAELTLALTTNARIVGVNARDLRTFSMDAGTAQQLVEQIPAGRIAVYMSGIRSIDDVQTVAKGRADALLVGEGLMRASNPAAELRQWLRAAEL